MRDFQELLNEFRLAAVVKSDVGGSLDPALYDRMKAPYRTLQALGEPGRNAFAGLLTDPAPTVRGWVAAALLSQGDTRALAVVHDVSGHEGLAGFNAAITLQEYEKGSLTEPFGGSAA